MDQLNAKFDERLPGRRVESIKPSIESAQYTVEKSFIIEKSNGTFLIRLNLYVQQDNGTKMATEIHDIDLTSKNADGQYTAEICTKDGKKITLVIDPSSENPFVSINIQKVIQAEPVVHTQENVSQQMPATSQVLPGGGYREG